MQAGPRSSPRGPGRGRSPPGPRCCLVSPPCTLGPPSALPREHVPVSGGHRAHDAQVCFRKPGLNQPVREAGCFGRNLGVGRPPARWQRGPLTEECLHPAVAVRRGVCCPWWKRSWSGLGDWVAVIKSALKVSDAALNHPRPGTTVGRLRWPLLRAQGLISRN